MLSHGWNEHRLPPSRRGLLPHPHPIDKHKAQCISTFVLVTCHMRLVVALPRTSTMPALVSSPDSSCASSSAALFCFSGGTAIFADTAVSHRSSAFFYSHKKEFRLASSLHCCFSLHLPMGIVVGKGAGYFDDAESPTIDASDADCACFADCGSEENEREYDGYDALFASLHHLRSRARCARIPAHFSMPSEQRGEMTCPVFRHFSVTVDGQT